RGRGTEVAAARVSALPMPLLNGLHARQHTLLSGDEAARAEGDLRDDGLRRQVAEPPEVLVEGDRDRLAQRANGGVGVAHRAAGSCAGRGTKTRCVAAPN